MVSRQSSSLPLTPSRVIWFYLYRFFLTPSLLPSQHLSPFLLLLLVLVRVSSTSRHFVHLCLRLPRLPRWIQETVKSQMGIVFVYMEAATIFNLPAAAR